MCTVADEDLQLDSPFTKPLTTSMLILKEKQTKEKSHVPGASKILAKAREKLLNESSRKKVCKLLFANLCFSIFHLLHY